MSNQAPVLLTDEQMRQFITEGFLILQTDFTAEFHRNLMEQLNQVYREEGNPGNNLLPRIRELQRVFENPIVTGALTSVLGPNYLMHTHRHGHYNATAKPGGWHKDSYWGHRRMRNHHPWWAMVMYFPQDTPVELGPTGVLPGTQHYETRTFESENPDGEMLASGQAGTFALIHYDIWHRATANLKGEPRYMLKFEFMRTEAPTAPSWDCREREWRSPASFHAKLVEHEVLWRETWNWLHGAIGSLANTGDPSKVQVMSQQLTDRFEPNAWNAVYGLATMGREGMTALYESLRKGEVQVSRRAAYGLSIVGAEAVPGLIDALSDERPETVMHAAFALGELRGLASAAVPKLNGLLHPGTNVAVRQTVVEALGMIGTPAGEVVDGLIHCLADEDVQVRFMAGLALIRMGEGAAAAVPALELALEDPNRYVRGHAAEALHYIGTPAAKDVLIRFLLNSRWCPDTTKASTY